MKFPAYFLLATTLLATSACSKDDSKPVAEEAGRYTLDRREVVAETSYSGQYGNASNGSDDLLYIRLQNKADKVEVLEVIYTKAAGAPESTYRPLNLRLTDNQGFTSFYRDNLTMTITKNGDGYSGTFAGSRSLPASTGGGSSQISNGVFTNVK